MTGPHEPATSRSVAWLRRLPRRVARIVTRLGGLRATLLFVGAAGVGWLGWDLATSESLQLTGDRFQQIDAYVEDQRSDARIPGISIAIIEDGATVHTAGFGDDGRGNTVNGDTPFWIGSNTKSITALATMQLVEAGLIDLDAPVQQYLPSFRVADADASNQITVRHLLNQTSGISRLDSVKAVAAGKDQTLAEAVADMASLELNRPVGETFEYSNLNSVVLGLIIEQVTGDTWQRYVQGSIFDPLGMNRTFTTKHDAEQAGLTHTHRTVFGFPLGTGGMHLDGLAPTGYIYSTANDMARYLAMYTQGGALDRQRVLSEQGIAEMLTPATNERSFQLQSQPFEARYGAGWFVGPFGVADDARWHQGSLPHFTGWMVLLPDSDQAAIVLMNAGSQFEIGGANGAWSRIPQGIVNILRDQPPPTGKSTRFFIIFDTFAAIAITAQAAALIGVARNRASVTRSLRTIAPLAWEFGGAGLLLLGYPALTGGLGWSASLAFLPDLSLTVLGVASLAALTGIARLVRLLRPKPSLHIDLTSPERNLHVDHSPRAQTDFETLESATRSASHSRS